MNTGFDIYVPHVPQNIIQREEKKYVYFVIFGFKNFVFKYRRFEIFVVHTLKILKVLETVVFFVYHGVPRKIYKSKKCYRIKAFVVPRRFQYCFLYLFVFFYCVLFMFVIK